MPNLKQLSKPSLLCVEDDPDQLFLIELAARRSGRYGRIEVALDGRDALRVLDQMESPPDIIVADLKMPGIDGVALLERLKEKPWTPNPLFVILTSSFFPGDRERAVEAGCRHYVQKPAEFPKLVDLMIEFSEATERAAV
jgi:two-component system cell cycle response regulator DivK